jgi:hypothetical protein
MADFEGQKRIKHTMKKVLLLVIVSLFSAGVVMAQEHIEKRYSIYYRVGRSDIDPNYKNNGHTIRTMVNDVMTTLRTDGILPDSLLIYASTSPEGSAELNERLAVERAENARLILAERFPQFKPSMVKVESRANDWSGMVQILRQNTSIRHRDAILKIITDPRIENKDAAVRAMPEAYEEIRGDMFDNMRTATVTLIVVGKKDEFTVEPELYMITESPLSFPAEGADGTIAYSKNVSDKVVPEVRCDAEWIQNIKATESGITFTVLPNPVTKSRTAPVTLTCYGQTHEITINQAAAEPTYTLTSESSIEYPVEGGLETVTYETNSAEPVAPVLTCDAEWLTVTADEAGKVNITAAKNTKYESRNATVGIECLGMTHTVSVIQAAAEKVLKPFYMSVKTNMLYDAAIVPNVGVEFYLGKNFSINGNWMYSWWKSDKVAWYWRTYGGDLAVRYWFGKAANEKPLTGHHVGLYGQIVTYDFEVGGRGYLGDRWSYGAGAEYGYSLPVKPRLNIDFNIGVGYLGGEYKEYLPIDGHYVWQVTKRRHWFGPTKAEISLTWLLGRGNENKGKGGKR